MGWSYNREVPAVDRCHTLNAETLRQSDDRRIHRPERQVSIAVDQFSDTKPIGGLNRRDVEVS